MSIDAEMTRVKIPIKSGLTNGYFFTIFLHFFLRRASNTAWLLLYSVRDFCCTRVGRRRGVSRLGTVIPTGNKV